MTSAWASFTPCPCGTMSSCPRGVQWWWADQRQQEGSDTRVMAALQKPEETLVPTKMYSHRAAHPSPAAAAELLLSGTSRESQVPPPAKAPHPSTQHCCMVHSTISHLSANCKALGDSENKAIHRGVQKAYSYSVLSEDIPLLQARLNYLLKFYWHKDLLNFHYTSHSFYSYLDNMSLPFHVQHWAPSTAGYYFLHINGRAGRNWGIFS